MTLNYEVQTIKLQLTETSKELESFERDSQQTINNDHTQILSDFRLAVDAILHTIRFLDGDQAKLLTTANDRETAVQVEAASLNSAFDALRKSADVGLVNIKAINVQCHEFDDTLVKIRNTLNTTHENIACNLDLARERLRSMRAEVKTKTKSQGLEQSKMEEMNKAMEEKKDEKTAMRFVSFLATSSTIPQSIADIYQASLCRMDSISGRSSSSSCCCWS